MDVLPLLATAWILGMLHTFGPDHVAAVSTFAVRQPAPWRALQFGLHWAIGHGGALMACGALLVLTRIAPSEQTSALFERLVGLSIVLLGWWTFRRAGHQHVHAHDGRAATTVGALHGLAGAAPVLALLTVARAQSSLLLMSSLAAFAIGTACAMAAWAFGLGALAQRTQTRSLVWGRTLSRVTGACAMCTGMFWFLRHTVQ